MTHPSNTSTKTYIVRVAQDLSEYADVQVDATSTSDAEDIVSELLSQGKLKNLRYTHGDDRENPYTCDSWEREDETTVDCIIQDNRITFSPQDPLDTATPSETQITNPPYAVRPYQDDPNVDAFEIIATTGNIRDLGPIVVAVIAEYESGQLLPHVTPEIRSNLQADADFIARACNAYQTAITTLQTIANYGDLTNDSLHNHPLRSLMLQLSSQDCAELARTALQRINPAQALPDDLETESEETNSYRIEIQRCPLFLNIEARSGRTAIADAITLLKHFTQNDDQGIHLPLTEPGDHDAAAFIYPSLDAKDYRITQIEPLY